MSEIYTPKKKFSRCETLHEVRENAAGERKQSFAWEYEHYTVKNSKKKANDIVQCKYCDKVFHGGLLRMRSHLMQKKGQGVSICLAVPPHVKAKVLQRVHVDSSFVSECKTTRFPEKREMDCDAVQSFDRCSVKHAQQLLCMWILESGIPLSSVKSDVFRETMETVALCGKNWKPITYEMLKEDLLGKSASDVELALKVVSHTLY